jgi:hypothetical protein
MLQVPQSTARVVMLKVFETGTTTAATGKTVAVTLSKAGAAFANPNAGATNATEVASGWYKVTLDATDTATLGDLVVRGTAAACDDSERVFGVVDANNGGLVYLDQSVNAVINSVWDVVPFIPIGDSYGDKVLNIKAKTDSLTFTVAGQVDATVAGMAADTLTAAAVADGAIDRAAFAADTGLQTIRSGTAQAGDSTTITLDAGASAPPAPTSTPRST